MKNKKELILYDESWMCDVYFYLVNYDMGNYLYNFNSRNRIINRKELMNYEQNV